MKFLSQTFYYFFFTPLDLENQKQTISSTKTHPAMIQNPNAIAVLSEKGTSLNIMFIKALDGKVKGSMYPKYLRTLGTPSSGQKIPKIEKFYNMNDKAGCQTYHLKTGTGK